MISFLNQGLQVGFPFKVKDLEEIRFEWEILVWTFILNQGLQVGFPFDLKEST